MAYATLLELKTRHLTQLLDTAEHDSALRSFLESASGVLDSMLGHGWGAAAPGSFVAFGSGTDYLRVPAGYVAGSVTGVSAPTGIVVPPYVERDQFLVATWAGSIPGGAWAAMYPYTSRAVGWGRDIPYTVAASYGYGAIPEELRMIVCEIAVMLWRFRDSGGAQAVGTDAGTITVRERLSPLAQAIIDKHKAPAGQIGVF